MREWLRVRKVIVRKSINWTLGLLNCEYLHLEPRVRAYECESRYSIAPQEKSGGGNVRLMAMSNRAAPMMMMDAAPEIGMNFSEKRKPVEIRTKFPETWLFDNLEFDSG